MITQLTKTYATTSWVECYALAMTQPASSNTKPSKLTDILLGIGFILGLSYPILALSTGVRSIYQLLFKAGVTNYLAPSLSGVAALCYLVATVGFFKRKPWAWRLSVASLGIETLLTFIVGTLSFIVPEVIGSTVWRHFGADYGYFPLFQPLMGLAWLVWPQTLKEYGLLTAENPLSWWQAIRAGLGFSR
jgi:hypothetical protein